MPDIFYPDVWIRIPLYAALGLLAEIFFTGTMDLVQPRFLSSWHVKNSDGQAPSPIRRDPRAVAYTFLWMAPIYASLVFIEPLSQWMAAWPFWARGLIYLLAFWFGEYTTGALIKKIIGVCPWDYSHSKYSFHGFIRWDFAPIWFGFSFIVEFLSGVFVKLTPAIKQLF